MGAPPPTHTARLHSVSGCVMYGSKLSTLDSRRVAVLRASLSTLPSLHLVLYLSFPSRAVFLGRCLSLPTTRRLLRLCWPEMRRCSARPSFCQLCALQNAVFSSPCTAGKTNSTQRTDPERVSLWTSCGVCALTGAAFNTPRGSPHAAHVRSSPCCFCDSRTTASYRSSDK